MTAAKITTGPIFRPVNRYGTVGKKALSGLAVPRIVKEALTRAGIDAKDYSGHSLRAGLVTAAAMAGVSERIIMLQTGIRTLPYSGATFAKARSSARTPPQRSASSQNAEDRAANYPHLVGSRRQVRGQMDTFEQLLDRQPATPDSLPARRTITLAALMTPVLRNDAPEALQRKVFHKNSPTSPKVSS